MEFRFVDDTLNGKDNEQNTDVWQGREERKGLERSEERQAILKEKKAVYHYSATSQQIERYSR